MSRYVSIWFPHLQTDYTARKKPQFREKPFVLASPQRGRMIIDAVCPLAAKQGVRTGMVVADAKAIFPELQMLETMPGRNEAVLKALAEWCISYTPFVAIDLPDGLLLDATGCTHLWKGEARYLESIKFKLNGYGYSVKAAIADTIGTAWATARFSDQSRVAPGNQREALGKLTPAALRLEPQILSRLKKLGMTRIDSFIAMPPSALRRRFGPLLPLRLHQALGEETEKIVPIKPVAPYQQRLCCLEPISTATGITIALQQLLDTLCMRFENEGIGLRQGVFKAYRIDGNIQQLEIGTAQPSRNATHLFRLFEHKIATFEPDLGFEAFILEALKVEPVTAEQAAIWTASGQNDKKVAELIDRVIAKSGSNAVSRYLPAERYWPENSVRQAMPLWEKPPTAWRSDLPRPVHLLERPEKIEVTNVLPDYPPMLFRYKGKLYHIARSDGPERIEQEWWLTDGLYRDYYCVEDDSGSRYWLFRSGPYDTQPEWFIHGFFA